MEVETDLKAWKIQLSGISKQTSQMGLDSALTQASEYLLTARSFLDAIADALSVAVATTKVSATTLTTYRTSVTSARTTINNQMAKLNTLMQTIASQKVTNQKALAIAEAVVDSAKNALQSAEEDLDLKLAGATYEQMQAQEAAVHEAKARIGSQEALVRQSKTTISSAQAAIKQAEANVEKYEVELSKKTLRAPISGVVVLQEASPGEIIAQNMIVVEIFGTDEFQIETYIPEVDIAYVNVSNTAKVTFDAYGSEVEFHSIVVGIDPAETVREGVSTYKTTLMLTKRDERVKPGMTANIEILTAKRDNVIAIPQRAVIRQNGSQTVRVLIPTNNTRNPFDVLEQKVVTGLKGSDGMIEVIEGVSEGDRVLISTRRTGI